MNFYPVQTITLPRRLFFQLSLLLLLLLPGTRAHAGEHNKSTSAIRFGVLSIAQPARIYTKWQPFADYMSARLGRPVELVIPRGFGKMEKTIEEGKVDFFYINSYVFYRLYQADKVTPVAQMKNIAGKTTSQSEIFVRKNSGIQSIEDLKGKSIAFVSLMGAGGYVAPRAYLYESGLKDNKEFKPEFTKSLLNSIHGVLLGDYDAAAMCGLNFKLMRHKIKTGELKIIATSKAYPENLIAARTGLPADLVSRFHHQLLIMDKNKSGNQMLDKMRSMKIGSFVNYDIRMNNMTKKLLDIGHL